MTVKQNKQTNSNTERKKGERFGNAGGGKDKLARVVPRRAVIPFTAIASEVSFSASPWDQARSKIHNLLCHSPALAELADSRNKRI